MDTFTTLWNRLLLRAPAVGAALSQDLIRDCFNQLAERREWSWLQKSSAFFPPTFATTGSVSVTQGSPFVTGVGTNFDATMVGVQIRIGGLGGSSFPTYTITQVPSTTLLVMDQNWAAANLFGQQYMIFQCYFPVPSDFNYFYSIVNTTSNYQLQKNLTQFELDRADPQRVQTGITFAVAFYDYTRTFIGTVASTLQVHGSGPTPLSITSTGFTFPSNSIYTIEITTGGAVGSVIFEWKQNNGAYTTGVPVPDSNPIDLSNGVQIYFPAGIYITGDVFVIQCFADTETGVPRYELWPRPINCPYVYPYLYIAKWPDLTDDNPALPDLIARRGDVILEMAMSNCARHPGTESSPNPYYDLGLADRLDRHSESMIYEIELKDDDLASKNLKYQEMPYYPAPWLDGSWLQTHAIYPTP